MKRQDSTNTYFAIVPRIETQAVRSFDKTHYGVNTEQKEGLDTHYESILHCVPKVAGAIASKTLSCRNCST
jgi:hypothetical protein